MDVANKVYTLPFKLRPTVRQLIVEYNDRYCNSGFGHIMLKNVSMEIPLVYGELFNTGINWGRVLGALAFADHLCFYKPHEREQIITAASTSLKQLAGDWIEKRGGWDDMANGFKRPSWWDYIKNIFRR